MYDPIAIQNTDFWVKVVEMLETSRTLACIG